MNGVRIEYGDIAVGAKEDFSITVNDKESFVDISQIVSDVAFPNYENAAEEYTVALDGLSLPFPDDPDGKALGWWSNSLTDGMGSGVYLEMIITSPNKYTTTGFTFTFDTVSNVYPTYMEVMWMRDEELIDNTYVTVDSPVYFLNHKVEFFDKVYFYIYGLNTPNVRMKLHSLVYGRSTIFTGSEIRSAKVTQTIDPISTEIAINTTDFTISDARESDYLFQARQSIKTYFNDRLIGTSFIKSSKRKSKTDWDLQTEDYIGLMDGVSFAGSIYNNKSAVELLDEIFTVAKVPCSIEGFENVTVTGHIPYTTCRNALMQVAFAIQAVVDTSYSESVEIYKLSDETQAIPLDRVFQGQSTDEGTRVTEVTLTAHTYSPTDQELTAYEAEQSGSGNGILVVFSEPLHDLEITDGTIISYGANHAVINAGSECVLKGKKYEHTQVIKRKKNPLVLQSDIENSININQATLISGSNVDNVLEKCYNYLTRTNKMSTKIAERKHTDVDGNVTYDTPINVGDKLIVERPYAEGFDGTVTKAQFGLNGGILVKEVEIV